MMLQISQLSVFHCVDGWYIGMAPSSTHLYQRFSRNYLTEAEATDALKTMQRSVEWS